MAKRPSLFSGIPQPKLAAPNPGRVAPAKPLVAKAKPTVAAAKPTVAAPRATPAKPLQPTTAATIARTGTPPSGLAEAFYDPLGSYDSGSFGGAIGGHSDHVHFSFSDPQLALRTIQQAQQMGLRVGENPYVGDNPEAGIHVNNSFHYRTFPGLFNGRSLGEAIDVSGSPSQMARLYRAVTGGGSGGGAATTQASYAPASSSLPAPLSSAITTAAKKYGVSPDVLAGIWRIESGSTFPNPAVNSSGYGGLFGTHNWNASTQQQADTAAKILAQQIRAKGSLPAALLAYSGGGYSSVSGLGGTTTAGPSSGYGSSPGTSPSTGGVSMPPSDSSLSVAYGGGTGAKRTTASAGTGGITLAQILAAINKPTNTAGVAKTAGTQAHADTTAMVTALRAQQAELHRQAQQQADQINAASQAAANNLASLDFGGKLAAGYRGAAGDQATLAKGFSGELQSTIGAETAKVQTALDAIGGAGTAPNTSAAAGNTVYGIGGQLPANAMLAAAPAAIAAANAQPAQITAYGQQEGIGAIGAGNKAAQLLEPDIATAIGGESALKRKYLTQLQTAAEKAHQSSIANTFKALAYVQKGDKAAADEAWRKAQNDSKNADRLLKKWNDEQRLGISQQNANTSAGRAATAAAQGETRLGIAQQNADTAAGRAATAAAAAAAKAKKGKGAGGLTASGWSSLVKSTQTTLRKGAVTKPGKPAGKLYKPDDPNADDQGFIDDPNHPATTGTAAASYQDALAAAVAGGPNTPRWRAKATQLVNAEYAMGENGRPFTGTAADSAATQFMREASKNGVGADAARARARSTGVLPDDAIERAIVKVYGPARQATAGAATTIGSAFGLPGYTTIGGGR